jgi:hypothetical protein
LNSSIVLWSRIRSQGQWTLCKIDIVIDWIFSVE